MPNLTDFVHIFSKRGYLQCVFVHWRDLKTKSKSTAYLLENWNSSTTAPDALFSPWWASTASSHRLCCSSWSCFRCAAALSACTLPAYPRLENHPFRRTRASDVGAALPCLRPGFPILASRQSRRQIEASTQSRSEFADPRYRPRGRITKSVTVTTAYNRTILSGTAASAQYKMAKAALHLNQIIRSIWIYWLRPAGGDHGVDRPQNMFFDGLCFFEWTWPFWTPLKAFCEEAVWFKAGPPPWGYFSHLWS